MASPVFGFVNHFSFPLEINSVEQLRWPFLFIGYLLIGKMAPFLVRPAVCIAFACVMSCQGFTLNHGTMLCLGRERPMALNYRSFSVRGGRRQIKRESGHITLPCLRDTALEASKGSSGLPPWLLPFVSALDLLSARMLDFALDPFSTQMLS